MPPDMPLQRPIQNLRAEYHDADAPRWSVRRGTLLWRLATFLPAIATTAFVVAVFTNWFAMGGLSGFETLLIALVVLTFFWIALSVATATVGVISRFLRRASQTRDAAEAMDIALLIPVYNEDPEDVLGNAAATLAELEAAGGPHRYALFVLSDTRDDAVAERELRAVSALRAWQIGNIPVYYRRRPENTDRKVGNLGDWVERWGGGYAAMVVLDADSLMSGRAIADLASALGDDPAAGLIQSCPRLFGAETWFARIQQFSSTIYGAPLAEGLATWTGREGNYWGHNAIIRTRAFASCAGLPKIGRGRLILSHDFVEAGLLRRAGWAVRFLPQIRDSYEEVPPTLIDYVLRDRRWCQGNLQHLRLLATCGFHNVSRFHMIQGAMGYLLSPAWFLLLIAWALIGNGEDANVIQYFSGLNPQVSWPEAATSYNFAILIFMYSMLLAPKAIGALALLQTGAPLADVGGRFRFAQSLVIEIVSSIAYAPILMIQQTVAVLRTVVGYRETWRPQARRGSVYGYGTLLKFHALETVIGVLLTLGMAYGLISLWLLPIAVSLVLAVPLSRLSGFNLAKHPRLAPIRGTAEVFNAPQIIQRAKSERARLRSVTEEALPVAAE